MPSKSVEYLSISLTKRDCRTIMAALYRLRWNPKEAERVKELRLDIKRQLEAPDAR